MASTTKLRTLVRQSLSVSKERTREKIRNGYYQAPHLTQDTNGKVTTSQLNPKRNCNNIRAIPYINSNIGAPVLLDLLNTLRKNDKCSANLAFYRLSLNRFDKLNVHEHSCKIL